ncbi:ribose 1,5-bisphosphate phosphokinase [Roseivivax halodurans JCM 10272]|uniref:Ribose 1,5-bisphosphate phosphokinase PhnN n=1 Tax=Roseivivax halodurans JCM 10272 TaxID=1449350 RepID=X7ELL1_9RHOB|nr:phosphonate metabolism protein/1,5-bisphosphokinase (PRPP-forming) PhnN [Roseivivax halodurans]ETX16038.1 ribose 1,5-bisphosphate phosphokinase [Roseivivax halodurans JCM 10272]
MTGRLIAVVGPSGAGKDSVIAGLAAARPGLLVCRRSITRPSDETEPFESLDAETFERRRAAGAFALFWPAHGLSYGIPAETVDQVRSGHDVIANLSRRVLGEAAETYPAVFALVVTAAPETIAERLGARGREAPEEIRQRLARPGISLPPSIPSARIANDGPLAEAVAAAEAALFGRGAP